MVKLTKRYSQIKLRLREVTMVRYLCLLFFLCTLAGCGPDYKYYNIDPIYVNVMTPNIANNILTKYEVETSFKEYYTETTVRGWEYQTYNGVKTLIPKHVHTQKSVTRTLTSDFESTRIKCYYHYDKNQTQIFSVIGQYRNHLNLWSKYVFFRSKSREEAEYVLAALKAKKLN